ncbi:complement C1r subcomponent-like [Polyodon spathula]|uniref:complement C1r subcomponent-like n=1 Tax=Polyodon spathula TaxID=7913 RepID=UPI001B7E131E|nr:complement C1r subcomponent-like [Polyodon spathula]
MMHRPVRPVGVLLFLWVCQTVSSVLGTPSTVPLFGEIRTPNYPNAYPASNRTEWELAVPKGFLLKLIFKYFDVEPSVDCNYDRVEVMYHRRVLGKFCGQKGSLIGHYPDRAPIMSPGNSLKVIFQSDFSNLDRYLGFLAHYQAIDIDECSQPANEDEGPLCQHLCHNIVGGYFCSCHHGYQLQSDNSTCKVQCDGEVFREEQGVISSPLYPHAYPPTLSCRYQLRLERGFLVTLHFTGLFEVDHYQEKECPYDTLQIVIPGKDPQTYCGTKSPGIIETESHSVDIIFHTDESGYNKGWRIKYSSKRVKCPMPVQFLNGKIIPDFEEYRYRDYIKVRCDVGYKMMAHGNEITNFLSVCQNDGTWNLPLPQCHIVDCGAPLSLLNGRIEYTVGRESENVYQSVIKYHCNEPYYKIVPASAGEGNQFFCSARRKWEDTYRNNVIPTCLPVCGKPHNPIPKVQRILGGNIAPRGSFPWQVLLLSAGRAGAFLITDQWIMTAAHNIYPKQKDQRDSLQDLTQSIQIHLGDTNLENLILMPRLEIQAIFVHPSFQQGALQFNNDIALIKLRHRVTLNETVMPLCLPAAGSLYQAGVMGYVSGWGVTEGHKLSNQLKYVALPVVDLRQCNTSFNSERSYRRQRGKEDIPQFTENMFCAGRVEGGDDTCSGDSGGAFTLLREAEGGGEEFYAAGIVSWGVDCGKKGNYGAYTRVERYLSWIQQTIQEN